MYFSFNINYVGNKTFLAFSLKYYLQGTTYVFTNEYYIIFESVEEADFLVGVIIVTVMTVYSLRNVH